MDDVQVRKIVREEIVRAMDALAEAGRDGEDTVSHAAGFYFGGNFRRACDAADEQRELDAANPFKDATPATGTAVTADYVQAAVTDVLKHLRDNAYLAGTEADLRLAGRLDTVIAERETHNPDE